MANKPEQNLSSESGGHTYSGGLDLETKTFSPSGRGGAFFLTSLFIELIDPAMGVLSAICFTLSRGELSLKVAATAAWKCKSLDRKRSPNSREPLRIRRTAFRVRKTRP